MASRMAEAATPRRRSARRFQPRLGAAHFPAATFFSSSRNSSRILAASTPLALAFLIQSSMIGAERFFTSATNAGVGVDDLDAATS